MPIFEIKVPASVRWNISIFDSEKTECFALHRIERNLYYLECYDHWFDDSVQTLVFWVETDTFYEGKKEKT